MKNLLRAVFFFSFSGMAMAQSQSDAEKLSAKIFQQWEQIGASDNNLLDMAGGSLPDNEYRAVDHITTTSERAYGTVSELISLLDVYSAMIDKRDANFIKKRVNITCDRFVSNLTRYVERINAELPSLTSAALLNESTKLRDALSNTLRLMESCKTK